MRTKLTRCAVTLPGQQVAYEDWFITLYNLCYSSLPVLLVGLLDQVKTNCVLVGQQNCVHLYVLLLITISIIILLHLSPSGCE